VVAVAVAVAVPGLVPVYAGRFGQLSDDCMRVRASQRNTAERVRLFVKPGCKPNYLCVNDSEDSWAPASHFPPVSHRSGCSSLLFLVRQGTKHHVAFHEDGTRWQPVDTTVPWQEAERVHRHRVPILNITSN
jgi:hypothetical protein